MSDTMGSGGPELQARYESLRGQAIDQQQSTPLPQGMVLLIHSGLPAWMGAWAQVAPSAAMRPIARREADDQVIPASWSAEVVAVLAAMVCASHRGSV